MNASTLSPASISSRAASRYGPLPRPPHLAFRPGTHLLTTAQNHRIYQAPREVEHELGRGQIPNCRVPLVEQRVDTPHELHVLPRHRPTQYPAGSGVGSDAGVVARAGDRQLAADVLAEHGGDRGAGRRRGRRRRSRRRARGAGRRGWRRAGAARRPQRRARRARPRASSSRAAIARPCAATIA